MDLWKLEGHALSSIDYQNQQKHNTRAKLADEADDQK
jgi:hypothetical protein